MCKLLKLNLVLLNQECGIQRFRSLHTSLDSFTQRACGTNSYDILFESLTSIYGYYLAFHLLAFLKLTSLWMSCFCALISTSGTTTTSPTTPVTGTPGTTTPSTTPSTTTPTTNTPGSTTPYTTTPSTGTGVLGGVGPGLGPSGSGMPNTDYSHGGMRLQNSALSFLVVLLFSGSMLLWGWKKQSTWHLLGWRCGTIVGVLNTGSQCAEMEYACDCVVNYLKTP